MIELIHRHLPMLRDLGLIEWERRSRRVGRGPCFDDIAPILAILHEHRDEPPDGWLEDG